VLRQARRGIRVRSFYDSGIAIVLRSECSDYNIQRCFDLLKPFDDNIVDVVFSSVFKRRLLVDTFDLQLIAERASGLLRVTTRFANTAYFAL
jgi:hypothetical protein